MLGDYKNSKKQGDAGLGVAIAYFCGLGYPVSVPLTDSQDYDLVVEIEGDLKKIQVRTTKYKTKSGSYCVGLRVLGGNAKKNFVHKKCSEMTYDFLFVVTGDGTRYLVPKEKLGNSALTFSGDRLQYKVE